MSWALQHPQTLPFVPPRQGTETPFISLLVPVPTKNRSSPRHWGNCLPRTTMPTGSRFSSRMAVPRIAMCAIVSEMQAEFPQITLLDNPGGLSSVGRNVALERRAAICCCSLTDIVKSTIPIIFQPLLKLLLVAVPIASAAQPLEITAQPIQRRAIAAARLFLGWDIIRLRTFTP